MAEVIDQPSTQSVSGQHVLSLKKSFFASVGVPLNAEVGRYQNHSDLMPAEIETLLSAETPFEYRDNFLRPSVSGMKEVLKRYAEMNGLPTPTPEQQRDIDAALEEFAARNEMEVQRGEGLRRSNDVFYMAPYVGDHLHSRMVWEATKNLMNNVAHVMVLDKEDIDYMTATKSHQWTRDFATSIGGKIYIPDPSIRVVDNYRFDERIKRDKKALEDTLQRSNLSVPIVQLSGAAFEGGQIKVNETTKTIMAGINGHGAFTETRSGAFLEAVNAGQPTPYQLLPVTLRPPAYHLDLAVSVLPKGEVLVVPEYMDDDSLQRIKKHFGEDKVISVSKDDLQNRNHYEYLGRKISHPGANSTSVGQDVLVMTDVSADLRIKIEQLGYYVVTPIIARPEYSPQLQDDGVNCRLQQLPLSAPAQPSPTR